MTTPDYQKLEKEANALNMPSWQRYSYLSIRTRILLYVGGMDLGCYVTWDNIAKDLGEDPKTVKDLIKKMLKDKELQEHNVKPYGENKPTLKALYARKDEKDIAARRESCAKKAEAITADKKPASKKTALPASVAELLDDLIARSAEVFADDDAYSTGFKKLSAAERAATFRAGVEKNQALITALDSAGTGDEMAALLNATLDYANKNSKGTWKEYNNTGIRNFIVNKIAEFNPATAVVEEPAPQAAAPVVKKKAKAPAANPSVAEVTYIKNAARTEYDFICTHGGRTACVSADAFRDKVELNMGDVFPDVPFWLHFESVSWMFE